VGDERPCGISATNINYHKNTEAFGFSLRNLGLQFRIVLLIKA